MIHTCVGDGADVGDRDLNGVRRGVTSTVSDQQRNIMDAYSKGGLQCLALPDTAAVDLPIVGGNVVIELGRVGRGNVRRSRTIQCDQSSGVGRLW